MAGFHKIWTDLQRATYRWQKRSNEQGVGLFQRQRGFRPLYRMSESGAAQYPMLPFQQAPYMLTGIPMEAYTLRVRGLPLDATVGDVISFFSGTRLRQASGSQPIPCRLTTAMLLAARHW